MSNASNDVLANAQESLSDWGDFSDPTSEGSDTESDNLSELADLDDSTESTLDAGEKSTAKEEASKPETEKVADDKNLVEFKALGKTHQVPKPTDEQLPKLLAKAYGADKRLAEANAKVQEAEAKLAEAQKIASTKGKSPDVERASKLMSMGHKREAVLELAKAMGPDGQAALEAFLEDEREYSRADPSQRLLIDANRQSRSAELAKLAAEEKLKSIDDAAEAARESTRRDQYSGYIQDSFARYDLAQWIPTAEVATALNETLRGAALSKIGTEQRKREAAGQPDLTGHEIRSIVARQAKLLHSSYAGQRKAETSASKVDEQSKTAEQKLQQSTDTNQTQDQKIQALIKRGASATEIAEAMYGKSRRLF